MAALLTGSRRYSSNEGVDEIAPGRDLGRRRFVHVQAWTPSRSRRRTPSRMPLREQSAAMIPAQSHRRRDVGLPGTMSLSCQSVNL